MVLIFNNNYVVMIQKNYFSTENLIKVTGAIKLFDTHKKKHVVT